MFCRYFLGIPENKPGQQHLYRAPSLPPRTGATLQSPVCLTCVKETSPTQSPFVIFDESIYRVRSSGWDEEDEDTVITTPPPRRKKKKQKVVEKEPPCLYHNAFFSPKADYYVLECLGPSVPYSGLYKTTRHESKLLMWLQNNTALRTKMAGMAMPQTKTFPVQISGG